MHWQEKGAFHHDCMLPRILDEDPWEETASCAKYCRMVTTLELGLLAKHALESPKRRLYTITCICVNAECKGCASNRGLTDLVKPCITHTHTHTHTQFSRLHD